MGSFFFHDGWCYVSLAYLHVELFTHTWEFFNYEKFIKISVNSFIIQCRLSSSSSLTLIGLKLVFLVSSSGFGWIFLVLLLFLRLLSVFHCNLSFQEPCFFSFRIPIFTLVIYAIYEFYISGISVWYLLWILYLWWICHLCFNHFGQLFQFLICFYQIHIGRFVYFHKLLSQVLFELTKFKSFLINLYNSATWCLLSSPLMSSGSALGELADIIFWLKV